ncbi:hypothetical protein ABT256_38045 [Amycolatopsis japonica]|uniref:hypothetical protein n=1 Tax=Amycolatopsis japonica TaxID=208439 RepID=UPI003330305A
MCRTGAFTARVWKSPIRTPPLYPDAVTLAPDATVAEVLDGIDTSSGCAVKDSFACLDLAREGFEVLFEATWIARMADVPLEPGWARVDDRFDDPSVAVWSNGVAGVTAASPDCPICTLKATWARPGAARPRPERGEDLDAALRDGYTALGPLRGWLK